MVKQAGTKQVGTKQAGTKQAGAMQVGDREADARELSPGQRAYEARRAAKAGMSLDKWLAHKAREEALAAKATAAPAKTAKPAKPGFLARLMERAQRPLGS